MGFSFAVYGNSLDSYGSLFMAAQVQTKKCLELIEWMHKHEGADYEYADWEVTKWLSALQKLSAKRGSPTF